MRRKMLSALLSISLLSVVLGGCGGKTPSTQTNDLSGKNVSVETDKPSDGTSDEDATRDVVTLRIMDVYSSEKPHGEYVKQYTEQFMKENPNIKIELQSVSGNEIYTKLSAMATSPADLPTMFYTAIDQVYSLQDIGLTEDIRNWASEETLNGFSDGVLELTEMNGQIPFYPLCVQPQGILYRVDRFEEAGLEVPTTWDEFVECARVLTKDTDGDGNIDKWGFSMLGANDGGGQVRTMTYLWSNGFKLIEQDSSGKWVTDISTAPEFMEVFSRWTDMNNVDHVVPVGITEANYPTAANYFAMGMTDMFMSGSLAIGYAYANNPEIEGKLGSFRLPSDIPGTMIGTEGYAICSKATDQEKEAAIKFLEYFSTNDEAYQFWKVAGKMPATKKGLEAEHLKNDEYKGYLEQLQLGCRETLTFPGGNGLKQAIGDAYSAVYSGEKTNEEAVQQLIKDVEQLMEDYN